MLELRPTCENCNKELPPNSTEAMICTYECTFCKECVEMLENVCPNCGGNFCTRPIRPQNNLRNGNHLGKDPASTIVKYRPVNLESHRKFAASTKETPASER
ncbi:DUF1272 domain-containing protein [Kaarinaea lacus]